MTTRFAAAINDQGRFAPTSVGDFNFVPEANAHIWKGKFATSAADLAEQVNGAVLSVAAWGNPHVTLHVVEFGASPEVVDENASTPESEKEALLETIRELRETILHLQTPGAPANGPTLRILEEENA